MKRYLLFGYNSYYPQGGMNDFIECFDTLEEINFYITNNPTRKHDEYHWLNTKTGNWNYN